MRISSASSHRSAHPSRAGDLLVVLASVVLTLMPVVPVGAQTHVDDERILARQVEFVPLDGSHIDVGGRLYAGTLQVTSHSNGLALVEETTIDRYLLGIREVPFSWESAALRAQAVAARTYLAWTLERGRSSNGRRYGYDICATVACQVYAGVGGINGPDGTRWLDAVESTDREILLFEGRPAQALYSSTSSGRTRNVEDVFSGSRPVPYLVAVDSAGEESPFVSWSFYVPEVVMESMLRSRDLLDGELISMETRATDDGAGPWVVVIEGTAGVQTIDTWSLRTQLNRAAADLFPERFPPRRPGTDRRYPQTVMSPTFVVQRQLEYQPPVGGPPQFAERYLVRGGGWGHLVGMSQYGAQAMAKAGADHGSILGHYYGGLRPTDGSALLPETVRVGLEVGMDETTLVPEQEVDVFIDGVRVATAELGSWDLEAQGDRILLTPPVGLGLSPSIRGWRVDFDERGRAQSVRVDSITAAEVTVEIRTDTGRVWTIGPDVREAGTITLDLSALRVQGERGLTIVVTAISSNGFDASSLRLLTKAE